MAFEHITQHQNVANKNDNRTNHLFRLNKLVCDLFKASPYGEASDSEFPSCFNEDIEGEAGTGKSIHFYYRDQTTEKESCHYYVSDNGKIYTSTNEILDLCDIVHLLGISYTILSDIYGEFDAEKCWEKLKKSWLSSETSEKITGALLLDKISELGDLSKPELIKACGYISYEDGEECLLTTEFYEELLSAKGAERKMKQEVHDQNEFSDLPPHLYADCMKFCSRSGWIMRRYLAEQIFGVSKFSDKDQQANLKNKQEWSYFYRRLLTHKSGLKIIWLARSIITSFSAFSLSSDVTLDDRMAKTKKIWDAFEIEAGGINDERSKCVDDIIDYHIPNSSSYFSGLGFTLANVIRTDFWNKWHEAGWNLSEQYYKDVENLSDELLYLKNENQTFLIEAAQHSIASVVLSSPLNDKFGPKQGEWILKRMENILVQETNTASNDMHMREANISSANLKVHSATTLKPQKSIEPIPDEIRQGAYFTSLSEDSTDVIEHFGTEAPKLLNTYACAVEDALIEQVQKANDMEKVVEELSNKVQAMNRLMTNPELLLPYIKQLFGADGPYKDVNLEEELKRTVVENENARFDSTPEVTTAPPQALTELEDPAIETRGDLITLIDSLKAANPKLDTYDLAELSGFNSVTELASNWYSLVYGDQSIETPILALDAYLVDAPIYAGDDLESQIIDWYRQEVLEPLHMNDFFDEAGTSFLAVIKGCSKAFKLAGDINSSQYGNLWKKATTEYWRIGKLPNAFTCNQAISAVARFIVDISESYESPQITPIIENKTN